jgi:uncharacterized protein (DUF488 family)
MKETVKEIYTIGHSTHPLDEFMDMLFSFRIEMVADVRSFPGSGRYPHFNKELLSQSLQRVNIKYIHLPDLGGRRKPQADSHNVAWRHASFRGYADYMETPQFSKAIAQLEDLGVKYRTAYMCSEAVWWRCHRSLISDYLKLRDWKVIHIMGKEKGEEHPYTSPARVTQGKLFYD